ncbi:PIN domain-containing protein [candidate division KSB1 bacterium]|nr:PIN domain-containing protein [candidate division KSB1 bacterium]
MKPVFVDTSALIAMCNKRDQFHQQAIELRNQFIRSKRAHITTSALLMELGNAFSPIQLRSTAIRLIETIKISRFWQVIPINDDLFDRGFAKFKQMADKEWSLVDCISIIIAEELHITEIFTNDHHFEQAGFKILMK